MNDQTTLRAIGRARAGGNARRDARARAAKSTQRTQGRAHAGWKDRERTRRVGAYIAAISEGCIRAVRV
jgi:hypothetical protein